MSSGAITLLVIAICLVPLAGVFAAMDAALQRVSKARVEELRREGVKRADALEEVVAGAGPARRAAAAAADRLRDGRGGAGRPSSSSTCGAAAGGPCSPPPAVMTVVSYVLVGVGPRTLGRQHAYGDRAGHRRRRPAARAACSARWPRC